MEFVGLDGAVGLAICDYANTNRAVIKPKPQPLALVQTGNWVTLDTAARKLSMEVSDADLAHRREGWTAPKPPLD